MCSIPWSKWHILTKHLLKPQPIWVFLAFIKRGLHNILYNLQTINLQKQQIFSNITANGKGSKGTLMCIWYTLSVTYTDSHNQWCMPPIVHNYKATILVLPLYPEIYIYVSLLIYLSEFGKVSLTKNIIIGRKSFINFGKMFNIKRLDK